MAIITKVRNWLATCPLLDQFADGQHIDWTDETAGNYGIAPTGCSDVDVKEDIIGNITKTKQYNVVLYARDWTIDDVARLENTEFLDEFADWVEEQVRTGAAPIFGDDPDLERITAQNGMLYQMDPDGQTGLYQIQINITYIKKYTKGA